MIQTSLDSFNFCIPCPTITEKPKYVYPKCPHGRRRSKCKECGGASICEHGRQRYQCKECGGASICEHGRVRYQCKECGGASICEHGRIRSQCKECGGGSICEHGRQRSRCKECGGGSICEHDRVRVVCRICNPCGHVIHLRRSRRSQITKAKNPTGSLKDLCMTSKEWVGYLHKTFEDRYSRPKTEDDEVQIDEIIPCDAWNLPDDNKYCWHYLNSQWLIDYENQEKSAKYTEEDKRAMIQRIDEWFTSNPYQPCNTSSPSPT